MKVLSTFATILLAAACIAKAEPPKGIYEAIYSVNYAFFQFDYLVYADSSDVYVSALKLFDDLKIYHEFDPDLMTISGYISYPENKYKLDFRNCRGELRDSSFTIDKREFFIDGGSAYISSALLTKSTGMAVNIFHSSLAYNITSKVDLPIAILNRKNSLDQNSRLGMVDDANYPLKYPSDAYLMNGAMFDWALTSSVDRGVKRYGAGGNLGLQIIGGDLTMRGAAYSVQGSKNTYYEYSGRWRASFGDNKWLTQMTLGDLSMSGVHTYSMGNKNLIGLQISNESFQVPFLFSYKVIDGESEPGWQVDLFKNGQLVNQAVADSNGYYSFTVPALYGVNRYELKFHGNRGEYKSEQVSMDVPMDQLKAGEIRYSLNYGKMPTSEQRLGEGRVSMGITNFMTNTVYVANSFEKNSKPEIINQLNILPMQRVATRLIYNYRYYISGMVDLTLDDGAYLQVSHQIYDVKSTPGTALYSTGLNAFFARIFGTGMNATLRIDRSARRESATSVLNSGLSWYFHPFSFRADYFTSATESRKQFRFSGHDVSTEAAYVWMEKPEWLSFLNATQVGARAYWDAMKGRLKGGYGYISQGIAQQASFSATIGYDPLKRTVSGGIGLFMNLPYCRSNSGAEFTSQGNSYTQSLSGAFGFDPYNMELVSESGGLGNSVGKGVANMRLYLDRNDNGVYDYEDYSIPNVNYKLSSWSADLRKERHYARVSNLNPYERLYVQIDKNSISNPNWTPKIETFSFIADPNIFKVIDIPCYTGGVIEGYAVYQVTADSSIRQSGLIIHLKNLYTEIEEKLEVYSDGSFYKIGVAPGKYILYADAAQERALLTTSKPVEFEIKNTIDGDYVSDLVLRLYPTDKAPGGGQEAAETRTNALNK